MSWERASQPNPNPEFSSEHLDGAEMDLQVGLLLTHSVDSLVIDGHRLIGVGEVHSERDGRVMVTLASEAGETHLVSYNALEGGPVSHMLLSSDQATE